MQLKPISYVNQKNLLSATEIQLNNATLPRLSHLFFGLKIRMQGRADSEKPSTNEHRKKQTPKTTKGQENHVMVSDKLKQHCISS